MPPKKAVSIGTDCSGMETPLMALTNLGVEFDHLWACDVDAKVKETIMANFPPKRWYDDLTARDNSATPRADIYVAGFPCQPFSAAGLQEGFADKKGRGTIFWSVREYIAAKQPKVFVLENVSRLVMLEGGQYYRDILQSLEDLGTYNIYDQVLNTLEHGVPQNRKRIYFVGIKKSCDKGTFAFPDKLPRVSIEEFLDPRKGKIDATCMPPKTATTAVRNLKTALKRLLRANGSPFTKPYIADIDSTAARMKYMLDHAPCITCARCGARGHWVTNRGRRLNIAEQMRLQGIHTPADGFKVVVSSTDLGRQVGNAMSVNVLERLLCRILPAAGLAKPGSLKDRWAAAAARGRAPKPVALKSAARRAGGAGKRPAEGGASAAKAKRAKKL